MKKALLLSVALLLAGSVPEAPARAGTVAAHRVLSGGVTPAPDGPTAEDEAPDGYTLSAAYPNPFRSRTRFQLSVDQTQRVTVSVYNVLGQRVRSVFSGRIQRESPRSFTFKARSLPSGLYLYRVEGETFTATRRVTLVR